MDRLSHSVILDRRRPGSIYSTTVMRHNNGDEKVLMVSEDKSNVVTLRSVQVNGVYETSVVPLNFPNVPGDAEILALHCVNRSMERDDFAIGMVYVTGADDEINDIYFNIYSGSPGSLLDVIMKSCETLELNFLPYQLNHALYACGTNKKGIWLLSGSDKKIHAFKSIEHQICEQKIEEYFIEFSDTKNSVVLCFQTKAFCNYKKRVSFYGGETGKSMLAIVDSEKNQILHMAVERYRSPITSVQLFNIYNKPIKVEQLDSDFYVNYCVTDNHSVDDKQQVCMLVGSIECAIVFMNVLEKQLTESLMLIEIGRDQSVTTSLITDINFDSKNEILLGTHENRILSYAYRLKDNSWEKLQSTDLRYPIYTISYVDICGEGVKDAIIMTSKGIHILKHNPKDIIELIIQRASNIKIAKMIKLPTEKQNSKRPAERKNEYKK